MKSFIDQLLKNKSLPVFVLAGVVLFTALILEIIRVMAFKDETSHTVTYARKAPSKSDRVFDNLHKQYPGYKDIPSQLEAVDVPFEGHNYVVGSSRSNVKIVLFNDNDCFLCRQEQARLLRELDPYLGKIQLILKHVSKNAGSASDPNAAMFGQIAIRYGVYDKFLNEMENLPNEDMTVEEFLVILEKIGVSLDKQRKIMTYEMPSILADVQKDFEMAEKVGVLQARNLPVIFVNGYQLGKGFLPEHKLKLYIERALKGEKIVAAE